MATDHRDTRQQQSREEEKLMKVARSKSKACSGFNNKVDKC